MILICYDGSDDAKAAIEAGAQLLRGQDATVLSVWLPFYRLAARTVVGIGLVANISEDAEIDDASQKAAQALADEGAALAGKAGLNAQPLITPERSSTAQAILDQATAIDASAILMGSRGLTGVKSLLLGSVSHAVIQHADRPVIVVPSPEVASSRAKDREDG